jgi:two-component system cell cycle sensor histidine kinase PleC
MIDLFLDLLRAAVALAVIIFLAHSHAARHIRAWPGSGFVLSGFVCVLLAGVLEWVLQFARVGSLPVIGGVELGVLLEEAIGSLLGPVLIAVGLVQWLPEVRRLFERVSQHEEALEASELRAGDAEKRLQDAVACISEGFALYDAEDCLVLYNGNWMDLYGYTPERVRPGMRYADLARLDIELGAIDLSQMTAEEYIRSRIQYRRRCVGAFNVDLADGRSITIRERRTSDGGIVGIQTDITDLRRTEQALIGAKKEAELANRAKSDFLANMSHELRTPLNAIIGFAEVIEGEYFGSVGSERYTTYAADIRESGTHLLALISDILDISKIETGKLELHEENIDLTDTLEACLRLVIGRATAAGVELKAQFDDVPLLNADCRVVKQIVVNLLSNAVKFTPEGGRVTLRVAYVPQAGHRIEVSDTGIGIAPGDLATALTRFGQIDNRYQRKHSGAGLGLPLSKALVERHGGELTLESELGAGTTVTATFPSARAVAAAAKTVRFGPTG